jgi:hypothetical protein
MRRVYLSRSVSERMGVTVGRPPALVAPENTFSKTVAVSIGTNTIAIRAATDPSGK